MPNYSEITCAMACNKVKGRFPYSWDLNIYRGCEHGCKYCFAMYTHEYLNSEQYFSDVFVKTNIAEQLEKLLVSPSWKRDVINLGGVADIYQPLEAKYKLMPEILKLMIKYKNPCILTTKSDLILRDYDLIAELSEITYVGLAATITSMDENIRRKIEPGGTESMRRFNMLKAFSKTKATTGLHFMPIIPYLTDSRENIDSLFSQAKDCNVKYVIPGLLNLRGRTRWVFFDFIKKDYPELYSPLQSLYAAGNNRMDYKKSVYKMLNEFRLKYRLSFDYTTPMNEKLKLADGYQLSLFD